MLATVESIWRDIFHADQQCVKDVSFSDYVEDLYAHIQKGAEAYPNFLTGHSISIASAKRGEAKSAMEHTFAHMKAGMLEVLRADQAVREDSFTASFSKENFVDFVLDSMLVLLVQGRPDCAVLQEVICRVIYG